ncbi:hypothetical protein ACFVX6_30385 [Streptomyces sp. NPDC058289]|uniref:hypothetical protein n=1 Tax=Streptomyces sp. NPDC058289 TaxID=3346425 RepID=UPI0036EE9276
MPFTATVIDYDPASYPLSEWDNGHYRVYANTPDSDDYDPKDPGTPRYQQRPTDLTKLTLYPSQDLGEEISEELQVTGHASALLYARSAYVPAGTSWTFYSQQDFQGEVFEHSNESTVAHVLNFSELCSSVLRGTA